jgi:hypothetical protein
MDSNLKLDLNKLLVILDSAPTKIPLIANSLIAMSATLAKGIREGQGAATEHGINLVRDEHTLSALEALQPEAVALLAIFGLTL